MEKIFKKQITVWITADQVQHLSEQQAIDHHRKIHVEKALAQFMNDAEMSTISVLFTCEDGPFHEYAARTIVKDDFPALLLFFEQMKKALESPKIENKF